MSSDFNFTVTSWFLGNVCVKPYFNTQCLPPDFGRLITPISNRGQNTSFPLDFQTFLRSCLLNIIQVDILCNTKESNHKLCNRKKSECHKDCSTFLLKWRISEQLLHSPWHSNWKLFSMYNVEFSWESHKNF